MGILVVTLLIPIYYLHVGYGKYIMARPQMAKAIAEQFKTTFPDQTLSWVAGTWAESATLSFFLPNHPIALPGYPNEMPALVNPYPNWKKSYGVLLCNPSKYFYNGENDTGCSNNIKAWLRHNHLKIKQQQIYYRPEGFQYTKPFRKSVTVFWVVPHLS